MDVTVKVRFNASRESFEKYGPNRYLVYLPFPEDEDSRDIITALLSKHMGVPAGKIYFKAVNGITKDWVFQVA